MVKIVILCYMYYHHHQKQNNNKKQVRKKNAFEYIYAPFLSLARIAKEIQNRKYT